jgi:transposase
LLAAEGMPNYKISQELEMNINKVGRWRNRFAENRFSGIEKDLPRDGNHGGKDAEFKEKLNDVVGLYLSPPENAVVFCVDEKSSIQALDRTQPGLAMKPGRCGTITHDYKRHGTSTLFAALNTVTGEVIGKCQQRYTHKEFLSFLKVVEKQTPKGLDLHLIVDNYSTHKHEKVKAWLKRNKAGASTLHSNQFILAKLGGKVFWFADRKAVTSWNLYLRKRTRRSNF